MNSRILFVLILLGSCDTSLVQQQARKNKTIETSKPTELRVLSSTKKNKKSKKFPSSDALKLSIHKNTPDAYWSDNLKIAHGSTILAKSQMGSLSSTSQAIPAKMVNHHLNDHIVLLYGLYIGLPSALLLLFAFSIVAYYLPGRYNVQVWNLHFFICENNSHLVSNND